MKLHRTVKYSPELYLLVPLANVLFLLLAFVTLSKTFILQPGLSVVLPFSSFALGPERTPQIVSITAGAIPVIYFQDEKVTADELDQKLSQGTARDRSLIIRADRAVPYDTVSRVMNIGLQRGYSVAVAASSQP
ncbi:MAG: biopolymer transporter ExbD [Verrucomicrobiota bacterium]